MIVRVSILVAALAGPTGTASAGPRDYLKKPDAWFAGEEAKGIAANVLSWQSDLGGWPKNEDTTAKAFAGERKTLKPTYDNGATTDELRFLARMVHAAKDAKSRAAFERGFDYILLGQYPAGGWPQFHPPGKQYHRHTTFNDDSMVRLLLFLREVAESKEFRFLDAERRGKAAKAFDRGIACILKCQIRVNGKLTAWCAQHDETTHEPRPARTFELASLSGAESVGITRLLMGLEKPTPEVVKAVEASVAWLESAKLTGIRVVEEKDPKAAKGVNRVVRKDPAAPPLWARFYDLETNRPIFADRDGVPKPALADIGDERRNGYAWYGTWPQRLLEVEYPAWKKRMQAAKP
jgi:pectate lyase